MKLRGEAPFMLPSHTICCRRNFAGVSNGVDREHPFRGAATMILLDSPLSFARLRIGHTRRPGAGADQTVEPQGLQCFRRGGGLEYGTCGGTLVFEAVGTGWPSDAWAMPVEGEPAP